MINQNARRSLFKANIEKIKFFRDVKSSSSLIKDRVKLCELVIIKEE